MKPFISILTDSGALYPFCPQIDNSIIAAGPITKQPGTVAYRVVLRISNNGDEFIVHSQHFPNYNSDSIGDFSNAHFESGSYFQMDNLAEAVLTFGERVASQSEFVKSIYRKD